MNAIDRITRQAQTARTLVEAGMFRPTRPDRLARMLVALRRWGPTPAAGYTGSAARYPDELALVDERGPLTFAQVHRRTNALARALAGRGIGAGDGVAILCRNHRGFVEATIACSKLGADALYLNTAFAGPQIADVCARERPAALVFDEEFAELVAEAGRRRKRYLAWTDGDARRRDPALEDLIEEAGDADHAPPPARGRVTILTSGTTGAPKGAGRRQPESLQPAAAFLDAIPLRAREPTMVAAPMFHSWGFLHFTIGMALSSTLVLRRRFDPEDTLAATARFGCTALAVVPVMLQRILELDDAAVARHDLRALRVVAASGSVLPGDMALRVMDRLGDVLYNLYGSTEVAWATIATPADLRAAPGTAGRPPRGTVVKVLDDAGGEVPQGACGRIFVGNDLQFEGYTGGGGKEMLEGLMSSGDVGHFDAAGRLFVDGRDDEMIVSGGENVFPREVEDLLAGHPAVEEVAVVGAEDAEFGQRLRAFVVRRPGAELDEAAVRAHVKANLARFKVPRDVVFLAELPRNATGKVVKRELSGR